MALGSVRAHISRVWAIFVGRALPPRLRRKLATPPLELRNVYRPQAKLAPSDSIVVNLALSEHFGGRATPKPMVCGADNLNESRPSSQRLSGQIWSSLDLIDFGRTLSDRRDRFVA